MSPNTNQNDQRGILVAGLLATLVVGAAVIQLTEFNAVPANETGLFEADKRRFDQEIHQYGTTVNAKKAIEAEITELRNKGTNNESGTSWARSVRDLLCSKQLSARRYTVDTIKGIDSLSTEFCGSAHAITNGLQALAEKANDTAIDSCTIRDATQGNLTLTLKLSHRSITLPKSANTLVNTAGFKKLSHFLGVSTKFIAASTYRTQIQPTNSPKPLNKQKADKADWLQIVGTMTEKGGSITFMIKDCRQNRIVQISPISRFQESDHAIEFEYESKRYVLEVPR